MYSANYNVIYVRMYLFCRLTELYVDIEKFKIEILR